MTFTHGLSIVCTCMDETGIHSVTDSLMKPIPPLHVTFLKKRDGMSCRRLGREKFWSVTLSEDETDPLVTRYILCFQRRDGPGVTRYVSSIQVRTVSALASSKLHRSLSFLDSCQFFSNLTWSCASLRCQSSQLYKLTY